MRSLRAGSPWTRGMRRWGPVNSSYPPYLSLFRVLTSFPPLSLSITFYGPAASPYTYLLLSGLTAGCWLAQLGRTGLIQAANTGQLEVVRLLLDARADANAASRVLHSAVLPHPMQRRCSHVSAGTSPLAEHVEHVPPSRASNPRPPSDHGSRASPPPFPPASHLPIPHTPRPCPHEPNPSCPAPPARPAPTRAADRRHGALHGLAKRPRRCGAAAAGEPGRRQSGGQGTIPPRHPRPRRLPPHAGPAPRTRAHPQPYSAV